MTKKSKSDERRPLVADWQHLMRTFIRPEDEASRVVLTKYMEQIVAAMNDAAAPENVP